MSEFTHLAYVPREELTRAIVSGAYSYHHGKRLRWLQRLCLWALAKLGCQHYDEHFAYNRVEISNKSIRDLITEQMNAIGWRFPEFPKTVILGREQMQALQVECQEEMAFQLPLRFPDARFRGMKIIMTPWFDGIICLREEVVG